MHGRAASAYGARQLDAPAGGKRRGLDQAGDRLVIEAVRPNVFTASGDTAEDGPLSELGEPDPGLDGDEGARGISRVAADLDLEPAGLAAQRQQQPLVEYISRARPQPARIRGRDR